MWLLLVFAYYVDWQSFWFCVRKCDLKCSGIIYGYDVTIGTVLYTLLLAALISGCIARAVMLQNRKERAKTHKFADQIPIVIPWDDDNCPV